MESSGYIISAIVPLLIVLIGLALTVITDPYFSRRQRKVMLLIVALTVCAVLQDSLEYLMKTRIVNPAARTWNSILGCSVRPVIPLLFLYIVGFRHRKWPLWMLIGVNFLVHLTALFAPQLCFGFPGSRFCRGVPGYTSHMVSGILLLILFVRTLREYRSVKRLEKWLLTANALLVVCAVLLDSFIFARLEMPVCFVTISMVCSALFFSVWLHFQFVRQHEDDLKARQRVQIMTSQIRPHFLFNALNTIRALYARDHALADKTMEDFSMYLRQNLESLGQPELIPLSRELEHTRVYLELEMLQYPSLSVEYRIEDEDFSVPALTIQPLAENAIRHGVRGLTHGQIVITTKKEAGCHRITIRDNGVGFDGNGQRESEKTPIGIDNVRSRVEQMCGGTMTIESEKGKGTAVTLRIPFEQKRESRRGL